MLSVSHTVRIFLHADAVDLRKGFDGLSGLVSQAFPHEELLSGHLFLFLNGRRDRIKILHWDADGLVIGRRSERLDDPAQGHLFELADGAEEPPSPEPEATTPVAPRKPRPSHAPDFSRLPHVRIEHDVPEAEKACSCCGRPKARIGED